MESLGGAFSCRVPNGARLIFHERESAMKCVRMGRAVVVACSMALLASVAVAGQLVSTMRNVSAVMQSNGYMLRPVPELSGQRFMGDVGLTQAFEIVRPNGEAITLGRLNTSCVCVTLTAEKKRFEKGERAIVILHNVRPTPPEGQMYAIYVQLSRPRVTLRYDTFVQSGFDLPVDVAASAPGSENAAAKETPTVPSSTTPAVTGEDGIQMIIPRWEPEKTEEAEETEKTGETDEAEKIDTVDKADESGDAESVDSPETDEAAQEETVAEPEAPEQADAGAASENGGADGAVEDNSEEEAQDDNAESAEK